MRNKIQFNKNNNYENNYKFKINNHETQNMINKILIQMINKMNNIY